ncbi:FAD-dependent oxidoreductase [Salinisphaera hydrothermalis]|uniref:carboxylate--amine ligase n=1 Tax=Salinisphaera hydrothermalis TaxID=563188 RepID=UPI00333F423F
MIGDRLRYRQRRSGAAGQHPAAVVVGGGLNALGVVRSLAAARVDVHLLAGSHAMPAARSRYARVHCYDDTTADRIVPALIDWAARFPATSRRPLILTEEEKVAAVSAQRERLTQDFVLQLPPEASVTRLLHKDGFRAAAEAGGYCVPRSRRIRSSHDLDGLTTLVPPLVIKPAGRQSAFLAHFPRALRVESVDAAREQLEQMLTVSDDIVVQEWIDGDDSTIYFCLQCLPEDGGEPVSFVGRKLRAWPRQTGGTARCVAAPEAADALVPITTRFFQGEGVIGLAGMEYKWRAATQEYVMIEPTIGRTDHQEEIATLNGVNLPWAAYCQAVGGEAPRATPATPARIWKDPTADANAAAEYPEIAVPAPHDAQVIDALWRWDDPAPGLLDLYGRARRRFRRLATRAS